MPPDTSLTPPLEHQHVRPNALFSRGIDLFLAIVTLVAALIGAG